MSRGLFALFGSFFLLACAQSLPPVDRVQPSALEKSVFAGEWYYLQTVIDTPLHDRLHVRRRAERAREDRVGDRGALPHRAPQLRVDRRARGPAASAGDATETARRSRCTRSRATSTSAASTTRRPARSSTSSWRTRRTGPGRAASSCASTGRSNLVTDSELLALARVFNGIQTEPVAYYVEDPSDPDAPQFEKDPDDRRRSGTSTSSTRCSSSPTTVDHRRAGATCPSASSPTTSHLDCAPSEITVRHSFLRVDDRDYQPLDYTGDRMETLRLLRDASGPATTRTTASSSPARYRFANRTTSGRRATAATPTTNEPVACTHRTRECDDGRGSVCDLDLAKRARAREPGDVHDPVPRSRR